MKILIVQPEMLRSYSSFFRLELNNYVYAMIGKKIEECKFELINKIYRRLFYPIKNYISSEFAHYGELPSIIGGNNVYFVDDINPYIFEKDLSKSKFLDWENYPSCYGFPRGQFIEFNSAFNSPEKFDVIIYSVYAKNSFRKILRRAKKRGVLVTIFDNIDHEIVYTEPNNIRRDFAPDEYDLYFKKDIPLGFLSKDLLPLAPVPTKQEFFFKELNHEHLSDIFFVGNYRQNITRTDRLIICNFLSNTFKNSDIRLNKENISEFQYEYLADRSKILLSPAGRVWCSFRHTSLSKFRKPILLPKPNCETVQGGFEDGNDCIMYDVIQQKHQYNFDVLNSKKLKEKINFYLEDEQASLRMGESLFNNVQSFHTTLARSNYLLKNIRSFLDGKF